MDRHCKRGLPLVARQRCRIVKSPAKSLLSIAQAANGQLVIADGVTKQAFRFVNGSAEPAGPSIPDSSFMRGAMVGDRDGNVWIGTTGQGLLRIRDNKVDRLTRTEGLSSNLVSGIVEDQEGDIWVATARGIDRIRDPKFQLFSTLNGLTSDLVNAVYGGQTGAIWIGTAGGGLNRLDGERVTSYSAAAGLPNTMVLSLYEDSPGNLWAGTSAGLAVQSGERFVEVLTASGQHLDRVFNITGNHSGTVWSADSRRGLFAVRRIARPVTVPGSESGDIYGLLVARNGDVWAGHIAAA